MSGLDRMIQTIREKYHFSDDVVLSAIRQVPRETFTPRKFRVNSYDDAPLPIGFGQTMSQPYTVAFMTFLAAEKGIENDYPLDKVLEIGTGSGYQAAVLSKLFREVVTVEVIPALARRARGLFNKLGYTNITVRIAGEKPGWSEKSQFDSILITAGVNGKIPQVFFDELKIGGVLVAPIGFGDDKTMTRYTKDRNSIFTKEDFGTFRFVPYVDKTD